MIGNNKQQIIPIGMIDSKLLERIKLKAMKDELKKWVTINSKDRYTFGVLEKMRGQLESLS